MRDTIHSAAEQIVGQMSRDDIDAFRAADWGGIASWPCWSEGWAHLAPGDVLAEVGALIATVYLYEDNAGQLKLRHGGRVYPGIEEARVGFSDLVLALTDPSWDGDPPVADDEVEIGVHDTVVAVCRNGRVVIADGPLGLAAQRCLGIGEYAP